MAYKGRYKPTHPEKYNGDPTKVIYRSLWERRVMVTLDTSENIKWWASESIAIPYLSPMDGRVHKYYPDFLISVVNPELPILGANLRFNSPIRKCNEQQCKEYIILCEVKHKKQCVPPNPKRKKTKSLLKETMTYHINTAKWKSAQKVADYNKWSFMIFNETHIFPQSNKKSIKRNG